MDCLIKLIKTRTFLHSWKGNTTAHGTEKNIVFPVWLLQKRDLVWNLGKEMVSRESLVFLVWKRSEKKKWKRKRERVERFGFSGCFGLLCSVLSEWNEFVVEFFFFLIKWSGWKTRSVYFNVGTVPRGYQRLFSWLPGYERVFILFFVHARIGVREVGRRMDVWCDIYMYTRRVNGRK